MSESESKSKRNRWWGVSFVVSLILILVLALAGCDWFQDKEPVPKTYTAENNLIKFSRTVLPQVKSGTVFTVALVVEAKVDLELVGVVESIPKDLILVEGNLTGFKANLKKGDKFTMTYKLQAGSTGTFSIEGTARAKPVGAESLTLPLSSNIKITSP